MTQETTILKLESSDEKIFIVSRPIAQMSVTIKNMLEGKSTKFHHEYKTITN